MQILILQLKRIGDVVLTTPAINALRAHFPGAKITLVLARGPAGLAPAIRGVDEVLVIENRARDFALWRKIAVTKFDVCIDFTTNDRSSWLTLLSRAEKRIAPARVRRHGLRARVYNTFVEASVRNLHTVDYQLALLEPLGIKTEHTEVDLDLPESALVQAAEIRAPFVVFHPGSARAEKFWEPERWAELIEYAAGKGFACVLTGSDSALETSHLARITAATHQAVTNLAGKLTLLEFAALIARARLVVTVDSAPVHLAGAARTPQVALFGPTNPFHWRPRGTPAIVFQTGQAHVSGSDFSPDSPGASMNLISTKQVIDAMETLLSAPAAPAG